MVAQNLYCISKSKRTLILKLMRKGEDRNFLLNFLHLSSLKYVFKLAMTQQNADAVFPQPRIQLFRDIPFTKECSKDTFLLVWNVLKLFRWKLLAGFIVTLVYSTLNLELCQTIKEFLEVLQEGKSSRSSEQVAYVFAVLQIGRMIFGTIMKQIFQQAAIQIQSSIAKQLVRKALFLQAKQRRKISDNQIYQLQNVDLRLVTALVSLFYLTLEIPYTILVGLFWLFSLNFSLGFIALTWFLAVFIFHRVLDGHMKQCNLTKLGLIDQRSRFNYEFMEKIREARVIQSQSLMVQRNNDLFLEECHDHLTFYRYASWYDMALLLLPIGVVMTSLLVDRGGQVPITVEELYLIISILSICYRPMKDVRSLSIAWSDGTHALRRITQYLHLSEEQQTDSHYKSKEIGRTELVISQGTIARVQGKENRFQILVNQKVQIKSGERLVVLGRQKQGSSTFLSMIAGTVELISGRVQVSGTIAYASEESFILVGTLYENLAFFDRSVTRQEAADVCKELGLFEQLYAGDGLDEDIQPNKYNDHQLKLLALARVMISKATIYVLDSPFKGLMVDFQLKVDEILRRRQQDGVSIVITLKNVDQQLSENDSVMILSNGITKQIGKFGQMLLNADSLLHHFLKRPQLPLQLSEKDKTINRVIAEFQSKVRKALIFSVLLQKSSEIAQKRKKLSFLMRTVNNYSIKLRRQHSNLRRQGQRQLSSSNMNQYFLKFLSSCRWSESLFILLIILSVEVLHIFIHFFIGHEYQHFQDSEISTMSKLMLYQFVLTVGLAALIYLQGEISSHLAIIAGNTLYRQSLEAIVSRQMWEYGQEYCLRTADRFNHDYEEIFIFVHGILALYKNIVILIATAFFIGGTHSIVLLVTLAIGVVYWAVWQVLRRAHRCILRYYYDFKYEFVKVFGESIQGAELIKVHRKRDEVLAKSEAKYTNLAGYKIAANQIVLGQALLCDIIALIVTAVSIYFGSSVVGDKHSVSALATSIMLLLNLSDVLKAILDAAIMIQTFFCLNILPFMRVAPLTKMSCSKQIAHEQPKHYNIKIFDAMMKANDEEIFEIYPLSLQIPQRQIICVYESDSFLRNNLLYALTNNISTVSKQPEENDRIFVGGVPLSNIPPQHLCRLFGVVLADNFFFSGTLQQNLKWRCPHFDQGTFIQLAKELSIGDDLKDFKQMGLEASIPDPTQETNQCLLKKLAVIRLILHRVKIVIIMDTPPFAGEVSLIELLRKYIPDCTVVLIGNSMQAAYMTERVVFLQHMKVVEDGDPMWLKEDRLSKIGEMMRNCNLDAYNYRYRGLGSSKSLGKNMPYVRQSLLLKTMMVPA